MAQNRDAIAARATGILIGFRFPKVLRKSSEATLDRLRCRLCFSARLFSWP
jgi:hypothetical protein